MPDREEALHSYVTDMLALEEHIQKAVRGQLEGVNSELPEVIVQLTGILSHVDRHIVQLRMLDDDFGVKRGAIGEAVKRAGSAVAGFGAAAIDLVRTERLPKSLRDDYAAASLAYVGYLMLFTTASAFEDHDTAGVASECMGDYAQVLMDLQELIPATVVFQLRTEGFNVFEETASS